MFSFSVFAEFPNIVYPGSHAEPYYVSGSDEILSVSDIELSDNCSSTYYVYYNVVLGSADSDGRYRRNCEFFSYNSVNRSVSGFYPSEHYYSNLTSLAVFRIIPNPDNEFAAPTYFFQFINGKYATYKSSSYMIAADPHVEKATPFFIHEVQYRSYNSDDVKTTLVIDPAVDVNPGEYPITGCYYSIDDRVKFEPRTINSQFDQGFARFCPTLNYDSANGFTQPEVYNCLSINQIDGYHLVKVTELSTNSEKDYQDIMSNKPTCQSTFVEDVTSGSIPCDCFNLQGVKVSCASEGVLIQQGKIYNRINK